MIVAQRPFQGRLREGYPERGRALDTPPRWASPLPPIQIDGDIPRARYRGSRKNLFDLRRCAVVHNLHVIAHLPELEKGA